MATLVEMDHLRKKLLDKYSGIARILGVSSMNPFKVGDKVKCVEIDVFWLYGKEFIVTEVDSFFIRFYSNHLLFKGKKHKFKDSGHCAYFKLVQSAEQISFNNQMYDIVSDKKPHSFLKRIKLYIKRILENESI